MKKMIATLCAALLLAGCSNPMTHEGKTYDSYGLISSNEKSDKVCYKTNITDVVLGVIFFETIIVPIYTFGFDMYEPQKMKDQNGECN